jgi:putative chitinase
MLTRAQVKSIFTKASDVDIDAFVKFGEEALKQSGILDMVTRLQYFLAQLGHESNGLTHREENLNYSAARLMEIWPGRFPTLDIAKQYERNPEKLANFVYGGRMGNVNPGDGYRFRGRGYIQLTGRETYREIGRIAGLDLESHPELAAKPENAVKIACAFWTWKNINPACDVADFTAVTRKINGGTNGLNDRLQWLSKVKTVVPVAPSATKPATPTTSTTTTTTTTTPVKPKPEKETVESMANPAVMEAQKKLTRLGYYRGVLNGIYDQVLRAALWAFQKDEDLPQTGRLDARTREELNV